MARRRTDDSGHAQLLACGHVALAARSLSAIRMDQAQSRLSRPDSTFWFCRAVRLAVFARDRVHPAKACFVVKAQSAVRVRRALPGVAFPAAGSQEASDEGDGAE